VDGVERADLSRLLDSAAHARLRGEELGRFEPRRDFPTARGPDAVTIADLNGDRQPDLANIDGGRNGISILVNRGMGISNGGSTTQPEGCPPSLHAVI
jgi:hypothetical protein